MQARGPQPFLRHSAIGALAVALLTLIAFRTHLTFAAAIPLYLFVIVLLSLTGDFASSLFVVAISAGSLDFFFTAPLFSLYMTNPHSVLALAAFAFTSLVITRLVSQVRKEAISSTTQKERLDRLYQLSQELLHLEPDAAANGHRMLDPFRRHFGVIAICLFDAESMDLRVFGDSDARLADKTRDAYIRGIDLDEPGSTISVRCLRAAGHLTGAIGFFGLKEPDETVGPLTALTVTFLERSKAFENASTSAAAAQAEVYRSAILDALAHEFKTPLATILAAAGGLREAGALEPAQLEMSDTIENEATRLGNLTSRLLRTARLEKQDITPRMELTDLGSLIGRIAHQYAERSPDRRIVTASEPVEVMVDAELLRLAIGQLLENACKYSAPGSTVAIGVDRGPDSVAIRFSNSGSRIPLNERHRIFERFYRGEDARRSTSGSGLGLYIARKIAAAHGGGLDLEAEDSGEYAVTFSLKLPAGKVEVNDEFQHVVASE